MLSNDVEMMIGSRQIRVNSAICAVRSKTFRCMMQSGSKIQADFGSTKFTDEVCNVLESFSRRSNPKIEADVEKFLSLEPEIISINKIIHYKYGYVLVSGWDEFALIKDWQLVKRRSGRCARIHDDVVHFIWNNWLCSETDKEHNMLMKLPTNSVYDMEFFDDHIKLVARNDFVYYF